MMKIVNFMNEKKGLSSLWAIVICIVIILISTAIYEYMRLMIIASGVRNAMQSAIISTATANYDDTYASLREGHSGGYRFNGDGWSEQLDLGDINARLESLLGLRRDGAHRIKYSGNDLEFRVSNLNVNIINAPFAPSNPDSPQFLVEATIRLEVPLSFGWSNLPPMTINVRCRAGYTAMF